MYGKTFFVVKIRTSAGKMGSAIKNLQEKPSGEESTTVRPMR